MHVTPSIGSLTMGMLIGICLVLSCGDDSPGNVDAAACDCPAAEPPLAGRIMVVDQTQIIPGNSRGGQGAGCPQGSLRLSGSCTTPDINPLRDITLEQSGFYSDTPRSWTCLFKNNEATPVTIKASVVCLIPAS
jgi:hypothetical protein